MSNILSDTPNRLCFELTLFDDESVKEKLNSMSTLEAMLDDTRNKLPQNWNHFMEVQPGLGGVILLTIEVLKETNKR